MVAIFALCRVWSPKRVFREADAPEPVRTAAPSLKEVGVAWSPPFYFLSLVILLWSIPPVKALFSEGLPSFSTLETGIPGLTGSVTTASGTVVTATWTFSILGATGTAILLAVLATYLTTPRITASMLLDELRATIASLWKALALILVILVLANIANYSGGSTSMGTALAATGRLFPLIAPVIGWIGVFLTGSVVNNNTLFAPLQVATAETIGFTPSTLVAANTAGGNAAKVISPQSIAIAAGAVGLSGRESEILRASILYSLGMLAFLCVWIFVLTLMGG